MRPTFGAALGAAQVLLLSTFLADIAAAANTPTSDKAETSASEDLAQVVITGSLIPQEKSEIPTPITVITAEDIQSHGFANIAEALQRASFATGSVQGPQYNGGFTPGAQTLSVFGLSPSYVKYLIDGRPIADYPALYNGTDIIASVNGIPTELVDHIDVLLGGQSSIYGSDAIAGVVNIIMKRKLDAPILDARYGWTKDGGGTDRRLAAANSNTFGGLQLTYGAQYEKQDPVYAFQRRLTNQSYNQGTSPQTAERDFAIIGLLGDPNTGDLYYFQDPNNCSKVAGLFGGTEGKQFRNGRGFYCGTQRAGFYTIGNGLESTQGYIHADDTLNDHLTLFSDVLVSHEVTRFNVGGGFIGTSSDSTSPYSYYEDINNDVDALNLQHVFAPEEFGGMNHVMSKNTNNMIRATVGAKGILMADWSYGVDVTFTRNKLTEHQHMLFTSKVNDYLASIYGPSLGVGAVFGQPLYSPNYDLLYSPTTVAQYDSFSGYVDSYSQTEESLFRGQVTNTSLFSLPGGNAGLALVAEGGRQGWNYSPDPAYGTGETYLYTSTAGNGHRTRYAGSVEMRLPVLKTLTVVGSGRYDAYKLAGETVDKATYNFGFEYKPVTMLLVRGRYGTAFKAPTLADEFQGKSGFFQTLNDYYACAVRGFTGNTLGDCPYYQQSQFGTTSGNATLKPINAKVWDAGLVLTPVDRLSLSADFIHWDIDNEVQQQSSDQLLRTEAACRLGTLDITTPTCVAALNQVQRDDNGLLVEIDTPKINVSKEKLSVVTLTSSYSLQAGPAGIFDFAFAYSNVVKHDLQRYAGDPSLNLFDDPIDSTDFKTKENLTLTWTLANLSSTLYVEHYGDSPNYLATVNGFGTDGAERLHGLTLVNMSAGYKLFDSLQLSFAVNNLFDKQPPVDHSYPGIEVQPYNELNYSVIGRTYYVEATYKIGGGK